MLFDKETLDMMEEDSELKASINRMNMLLAELVSNTATLTTQLDEFNKMIAENKNNS